MAGSIGDSGFRNEESRLGGGLIALVAYCCLGKNVETGCSWIAACKSFRTSSNPFVFDGSRRILDCFDEGGLDLELFLLATLCTDPLDDCDILGVWYGFEAPNSAARLIELMSLPALKLWPRGGGLPPIEGWRRPSLGGEVRTNRLASSSSSISETIFDGPRFPPVESDGRLARPLGGAGEIFGKVWLRGNMPGCTFRLLSATVSDPKPPYPPTLGTAGTASGRGIECSVEELALEEFDFDELEVDGLEACLLWLTVEYAGRLTLGALWEAVITRPFTPNGPGAIVSILFSRPSAPLLFGLSGAYRGSASGYD